MTHNVIEGLLIAAYFLPSLALMLYGINLYAMIILFFRSRPRVRLEAERLQEFVRNGFPGHELPRIITQLPLYNEINVAERVMRTVASMDYPPHLHTIQVLDDSTDETKEVVDRVAAELRAQGTDIRVLRRPNRIGFKAGALDYGMSVDHADFYAIFDADFVPPKDFLKRMIAPMLLFPDVGLTQARWGHLNDGSIMTGAEALGIDGHFMIEQTARAWNKLFMNFNGTAGLWRRQAILDGGGWDHDTLTEDMDLSFRAQLASWKPYFISDLVVPAELPDTVTSFKSQQFRWAKGSIQTAIKLLPRIWRARHVPLYTKIQASIHMTQYMVHPLMVWMILVTLPSLKYSLILQLPDPLYIAFAILSFACFLAPFLFYTLGQFYANKDWWRRLKYMAILPFIGVGIAINNTRAIFEALMGIQSAFIRTPKKGDRPIRDYVVRVPFVALFEIIVGLYCVYMIVCDIRLYKVGAAPFLMMYAIAFTVMGVRSIMEPYERARRRTRENIVAESAG